MKWALWRATLVHGHDAAAAWPECTWATMAAAAPAAAIPVPARHRRPVPFHATRRPAPATPTPTARHNTDRPSGARRKSATDAPVVLRCAAPRATTPTSETTH